MLRTYAARGAVVGLASAVLRARAFCDQPAAVAAPALPVVYQYKICPYCHRVRAYLDYLKVPYEVVEVNPVSKKELAFSDYKKVPIAVMEGKALNGSDDIILHINSTHTDARLMTEDAEKWMEWSEKRLAVLLYPNITRTFAESWQCFEYAAGVESWSALQRHIVRLSGPIAMLVANKKIKAKYNILDERAELGSALAEWTSALKGPYLHGDAITLPDLMVYGVLRAVHGFDTFTWAMDSNPALKTWYDLVDEEVVSQEVCAVKSV